MRSLSVKKTVLLIKKIINDCVSHANTARYMNKAKGLHL